MPGAGAVDTVIAAAQRELGKPYVFGDAGPSAFDCSGLITYVMAQVGIKLPHNAAAQQRDARVTRVAAPLPGDLVFYNNPATHVGLYIGGGKMIHAPNARTVVKIADVYGTPTYGRVSGLGTATAPYLATAFGVGDDITEAINKLLGKSRDTVIEMIALTGGAVLLIGGIWLLAKRGGPA